MARIRIPLNNFSFGAVSPSLTSRTDSPVYTSAAESLKNFFIRAEGGVINRPELKEYITSHKLTLFHHAQLLLVIMLI